jgi:Acyl-CoA reductase (LuxC)
MNTRERAAAIAIAALPFGQVLGATTVADLVALVRTELGHEHALDDFIPLGGHLAKAHPRQPILHIVSGNTPAAGLQSLIRGLLLGAENLCKLPSTGLPEVERFQAALPAELRVTLSPELPEDWLARAEAVIVFGNDETILHFRQLVRPDRVFVAHGHAIGFGVVFDDPHCLSVDDAARDGSVFDQQGCLSPQVIYVAGNARLYAERLAGAMERFAEPRGPVSLEEANRIRALRDELSFRAANGDRCAVWKSANSTAWTVAFDSTPGFPRSPLHRFIFVKPLPADLPAELAGVRGHLSAVGIHPATPKFARAVAELGASRICPLGRMQRPPWSWRQDGQMTLAPLVRWVTVEGARESMADGVDG